MNSLKLPKWAQEYIIEIERQREAAVKALEDAMDVQTPSRIFVEDLVHINKGAPNYVKRYIQAPRDEVTFQLKTTSPDVRENTIECISPVVLGEQGRPIHHVPICRDAAREG